MRYRALVLSLLFCAVPAAEAAVGIYIGQPSVSIGINLRAYPDFVRVPGYPVYYAPQLDSNVFFYDGMYWVYEEDRWYASTWYNGPWGLVSPEGVPLYVLRVPVRYYRSRPAYFSGWAMDAPPRWGDHWGSAWQQQRAGWDRWDRRSSPAAAPLPTYQRQYSGDRYPQLAQQQQIQVQQYRYQPRDNTVQQYYRQNKVNVSGAAAVQQRQAAQPAQSAQAYAPGQRARQDGAESARTYAPGQVKQQQGAQSAKEFAPGQVHGNKGNAEDEGDGNRGGNDNGKGRGRGHGKD